LTARDTTQLPAQLDPATAAGKDGPGAQPRPKVLLHIGEPKTGTTFLQQVMWRNRAELAAQGVVLPGHHPQDHYRAQQDLRGIPKIPTDPAANWAGEWDIMAREARQVRKVAVISHELFCAADAQQADRAVRSLLPAEVHVVITLRDIATLLPAEWQETVKHRNTRGWEDWLEDVIDIESRAADRRQFWFWRVHDTMAILDLWSRDIPPDRVHVIMMPQRGGSGGLLWKRFASLLPIDPASVDITRARPNASLAMPEIEFLRRLNQALPAEVPDWFYMWNVKETLAHRALAARPRDARLILPASRDDWASEQMDRLVTGLRGAKYDIIGDLDELRPPPPGRAPGSPADQPAERMLEAAVDSAAYLVLHHFRKEHPAAKPQRSQAGHRGLAARVESTVASSPRLKRTVRELSNRHVTIRSLRILTWRALERSRARRSP
jgi:hypothetical protein